MKVVGNHPPDFHLNHQAHSTFIHASLKTSVSKASKFNQLRIFFKKKTLDSNRNSPKAQTPVPSSSSVSKVGKGGVGLASLGRSDGLDAEVWLDGLDNKLLGKVLDALEVKRVEEFKGENNLLKLHLAIRPLEHPRSACHRQVRILVRQIRSLHRYVTVVPEVKAVYRLVPVAFLFRLVFYQNA